MKLFLNFLMSILILSGVSAQSHVADSIQHGTLVTDKINSAILKDNRVGLETVRSIKIYLPPGYSGSGKSYPVIYFLHSIFWNTEKMFADGRVVKLIDRAFANKVVPEFIFVAADYSTEGCGSLYENSPVSGRWLDFTADELVSFIDKKYRTIPQRESRAIMGEFMGGRGALKLAMTRADIFSVVYALHPVATGSGYEPWAELQVDWKKMQSVKSISELTDGRAQIFLRVSQAWLPNPNKPPLYCDFFMNPSANGNVVDVPNMIKAKQGFLLDAMLNESVASLKSMRGIAFDWGRFDPTPSHVYSNRQFSRDMEDLGLDFDAEEYNGDPFSKNWSDDGRVYARVFPFLARHLIFEIKN